MSHLRGMLAAILLASSLSLTAAQAQQANDRERAQLRQMQQQLQKLQQDNSALQKERAELAGRAKEADTIKKELQDTRSRSNRDAARLREDLAQAQGEIAKLTSERDRLGAELSSRDAQLQALTRTAQANQQRLEGDVAVLGTRLKQQSDRADTCTVKHAQAVQFSGRMLDRYESNRLRLCEPFTGLYKVRAESEIQLLREQLEGLSIPSAR